MNPAGQIAHPLESLLLQQFNRFDAARSHLAQSHNLLPGAELIQTLQQLRQRDEVPADIGDLVFVLIAHIEQKNVFTGIPLALEIGD